MGPSVVWVSFKGSSSVLSPLCPASRFESLPEGRSPRGILTCTFGDFKGGVYVANCAVTRPHEYTKLNPTLLWYGHYRHSITLIDYTHEPVPGDCMSLALCSTTSSPRSHRFNSLLQHLQSCSISQSSNYFRSSFLSNPLRCTRLPYRWPWLEWVCSSTKSNNLCSQILFWHNILIKCMRICCCLQYDQEHRLCWGHADMPTLTDLPWVSRNCPSSHGLTAKAMKLTEIGYCEQWSVISYKHGSRLALY